MWAADRAVAILALLLVCLVKAPSQSVAVNQLTRPSQSHPEGNEPPAEGAYYLSHNQWFRMERVLGTGEKTQHVASLFFAAFVPPQRVLILPGAEAPVKIYERRPTLVVKQSISSLPQGSDRDVAIVRVDKKRDHRELQVTSGKTPVTFKKTFPKERITPLTVRRISPTTFELMPQKDLTPGQYFLTFGTGKLGGYDFQIM
jgi:hypothetical protein